LDLIEQISLTNQNLAYTSPYVRLTYAIVSAVAKTHAINGMLEKRMNILAPVVAEEGEAKVEEDEKVEETPAQETVPVVENDQSKSPATCVLNFD
jgi:hypothetical protein